MAEARRRVIMAQSGRLSGEYAALCFMFFRACVITDNETGMMSFLEQITAICPLYPVSEGLYNGWGGRPLKRPAASILIPEVIL